MIDFLRRNLAFAPKGNTSMPLMISKPKKKQQSKTKTSVKPVAPIPVLEIGESFHYDDVTKFTRILPFRIDSREFISAGERDAILASSGMGKSYLMGVILEEILEKSNQVVFIIDPEGEWYTLKDRYDNDRRAFEVVGKKGDRFKNYPVTLRFAHDADDEQIQEEINAFELKMAPLVRTLIGQAISCVFDTSSLGEREQLIAYTVIAEAIFKGENNLSDDDEDAHDESRKVRLVIDEAHVFAPENPKDFGVFAKAVSEKIAKRGRKRNIHLLVATQRPASINKNVLSQCNRFWLGGISNENDYKANKSFYLAAGLKLEHVQALEQGKFIYSSGKTKLTIKARTRFCKHGGATKRESARPIANAKEASEILSRFF